MLRRLEAHFEKWLIREFNGTRSNCRRAGKTGSAIWAAKRGEGRGGWSREVLTPPSGDDVEFLRCCDIQLPSKDKGNKFRNLYFLGRERLFVLLRNRSFSQHSQQLSAVKGAGRILQAG
jgi:hypothetical protein